MTKTETGRRIGRAKRVADAEAAPKAKPKRTASAASPDEPLDYILRVMRDEGADEKRRDAMAKEALPYRHRKRAGGDGLPKPLGQMNEAELAALLEQTRTEEG